jgi:hypothetical protein
MKMPPRKLGNGKREMTKDDQDQSYKDKRNKNNDAVKRSRQKTKVQAKETMDKVSRLKQVRILIFRWREYSQAYFVNNSIYLSIIYSRKQCHHHSNITGTILYSIFIYTTSFRHIFIRHSEKFRIHLYNTT